MDSVDSATAWTFSVEMSGSSCSASGATGPDHYSVFLLFDVPFEENHQITANQENVDLRLSIRPPPRLGGLAAACSLLVDPGRRLCAIFLTSHSSATFHQWLNLFSTRHECFTSDVGLTRTRLVSCILLTSLVTVSGGKLRCAWQLVASASSSARRDRIAAYLRSAADCLRNFPTNFAILGDAKETWTDHASDTPSARCLHRCMTRLNTLQEERQARAPPATGHSRARLPHLCHQPRRSEENVTTSSNFSRG